MIAKTRTEGDDRQNRSAEVYRAVLKLQRNIKRMTPEQRAQYADKLDALWNAAKGACREMFMERACNAFGFLDKEEPEYGAAQAIADQIMSEEGAALSHAERWLYLTGDYDMYWAQLYRVSLRIKYEAGGEIWIRNVRYENGEKRE